MATTLTILANDFSVAGVQAAGGQQFTFTPVNILFSTAAQSVVSRKQFTLTTGATGSGSTLIPDSVAGNGLRIDSSLNGWTSVTVANYPTGAISLPNLINGYAVNPATLAPGSGTTSWVVTVGQLITAQAEPIGLSAATQAGLAATYVAPSSTSYAGSPAIIQKASVSASPVDVRPLVTPERPTKSPTLDVDLVAAKRRNLMEYTEDTSNARYYTTGTKTPADTITRQDPKTGNPITLARFDFTNYYHNISTNWSGNGMAAFTAGARYILSYYVVSANPNDRVFWTRDSSTGPGHGKRFIQPNILTRVWQLVQCNGTTLYAIGNPTVGYSDTTSVFKWAWMGDQGSDTSLAFYAGGFQIDAVDVTSLDGIAGIGDSTMQGSSGGNDSTASREWLGVLEGMLNCNTFNRGLAGNKLTEMDTRWATDITPLKPSCKYVIIQGGINDISAGGTLVACQNAIISMVSKAKTDGFIPVLLTCTPTAGMGNTSAYEAVRLAFNSWLLATYGNVIDIASVVADPFDAKYLRRDPSGASGWYGDGTHYAYKAKRAVAEKVASWPGWDLPTPSPYQKITTTVYTQTGGFVMASPDGTRYRLTVANGGAITAVAF